MANKHDHNREIREEFTKRRNQQVALMVPIFLGMLILGVTQGRNNVAVFGIPGSLLGGVAGALLAGGIMLNFTSWRCPSCNAYLWFRMNPTACPKCKVRFRE